MPGFTYTKADLVEHLREYAALLGRIPSKTDMDRAERGHRVPASYTYRSRFGSWSKALEAAFGDEAENRRPPGAKGDTMIEDMRALAAKLGRPPTAAEMSREPGTHHANTYIRRYGTWHEAQGSILGETTSRSQRGLRKGNE